MKKLFLLSLLLLLASSRVMAGEREDYEFQLEKYRESYILFTNARDKFLKYQTLVSRKEAEGATGEILLLRTRVLKTFFAFLDRRLGSTPGLEAETREPFAKSLEVKVSWLGNNEIVLNSLSEPSFEKLFSLSSEVEDKDLEMKRLTTQVEGLIYLGKVKNLEARCRDFDKKLKENEKVNLAVFQKWLTQVENKFKELSEEIQEAEENWQFLADEERVNDVKDLNRAFAKFKENLINSQGFLKELISFQQEINRKLETEDF